MISDEAVEAGVNEMIRFTLHRSLDGVRIFKDGERFEGPWGYREYDTAERALAAYQFRAALEAALPHLLASRGCGTGHSADAGSLPALAPEWRRYDGKGRPVPNGTPIEIMQKNGEVRKGTHWSEVTWEVCGRFSSDDVQFWRPIAHPQKGGEG